MNASVSDAAVPDIYTILSNSSDDQLAPLVRTLVNMPLSKLKLSRAYRRCSPNHGMYVDGIGDEIYYLAKKLIGFKYEEIPSYQSMIEALCRKLELSPHQSDLAENESALLNLFMAQRFSSIAVDKRQAAVNEACQRVVGEGTDKISFLLGPASLLLGSTWPHLTASLLQIAFLRTTHIENSLANRKSKEAVSATAPFSHSEALVLSNNSGSPILTLAKISLPDLEGEWRNVGKDDTGISRLNPLLQAVPGMATAAEVGSSNYMNVIVPAGTELVESTKHGSLIGTIRKIGTNEFAGSAKLDGGKLSALVRSGAALNIASAMLAQKHLAAISKKLSEIKTAIEDVSAFQKNERRSVLTGSIRYFEQIAGSVIAGELSDEVAHVIETHEAKLLEVQDHLAIDIRRQIEALKILKDEEWFGQDKYIKAVHEQQAALEKLYRDILLCLRARACGWQLLSAFPGRKQRKEDRMQDIRTSLQSLLPQGELAIALDQIIRGKVSIVTSQSDRAKILQNGNAMLDRISTQSAIVIDGLEMIGGDISAQDTPLSMDLKIEDGVIVATRMRLSDNLQSHCAK